MTKFVLSTLLAFVVVAGGILAILHYPRVQVAAQRVVRPGELSKPHAFLGNNCAACHTAVEGVEAKNCIVCHADNLAVLQRQPSAFHADIITCIPCHQEHEGAVPSTTKMDHVALAHIGLERMQRALGAPDNRRADLIAWMVNGASGSPPLATPQLRREEAILNCTTCHQTKDRHTGLLGNDCGQCHATAKWTIPEFRHPSAASQSCAQCHQAPPSHYMMHFKMISMSIARMEKADVNQCFLCHQTTSWNDIKGVGFYKHH